MFNPAVYASRLDSENRRDATRIELDAHGNVVNPVNSFGNPWAAGAIQDARERRSFEVYADAMSFLDSVIGSDRDTETVNAFNHAMSKFESAAHASEMMESLQIAAGGGSNAALIAFAAASIYVNPFSHVNFSWYVMADYEGFQVEIRVPAYVPTHSHSPAPLTQAAAPDVPAPVSIPEIVINTFSPPLLSGPIAAPKPAAPLITPITLIDPEGRVLVATSDGWQAESESELGTYHQTAKRGDYCTCLGSQYYGKCWHRDLAQKEDEQAIEALLEEFDTQEESIAAPTLTAQPAQVSQVSAAAQPVPAAPSPGSPVSTALHPGPVAAQPANGDDSFSALSPRFTTHNGIFTADLPEGHRTFKIKRQNPHSGFMPDCRVIYLLTGSNPADYNDWQSFGIYADNGDVVLWKAKRRSQKFRFYADLLENPENYPHVGWNSDETCCFCNRMLTVPRSAELGYGPTCAKKRGLPYELPMNRERQERERALPISRRRRGKSRMWK